MSGAAMGLQAAGAGLGAWSSYKGGLAQDSYYKSLAAQDRVKEGLVQGQADQEITSSQDQGAYQSNQIARKTREVEGSQAAGEAENGTAGSVTGADISRDTFDKSKMDQMAIKYNADVASWRAQSNANMEKWNLENEARANETAGTNAKKAGKIGAVTSLLSGASQVASSWSKSSPYSPSSNTSGNSADSAETPSYLRGRKTSSNRLRLY